MFTKESSDFAKRAHRLYAQMGSGHLKEAVEQARAEVPTWHPHQSKGLDSVTHRAGFIAPRCPLTLKCLLPGVPRARRVKYLQRGRFPHSIDYEVVGLEGAERAAFMVS